MISLRKMCQLILTISSFCMVRNSAISISRTGFGGISCSRIRFRIHIRIRIGGLSRISRLPGPSIRHRILKLCPFSVGSRRTEIRRECFKRCPTFGTEFFVAGRLRSAFCAKHNFLTHFTIFVVKYCII